MPQINRQKSDLILPKPENAAEANLMSMIQPISTEGPLKILIYGWSGSGKTTFWSTFPKPILAFLCSSVNTPGEFYSLNTPELKASIRQARIPSTEVFKGMVNLAKKLENFKTITLDNATGLYHICLLEVLGWTELPAQNSWGMISRETYQKATALCKECLRAFLNIGRDCAIVAQERDFKNEENAEKFENPEVNIPHIGAALSPSIVEWLNPECDYIVETFIRDQKKRMVKKIIKEGDIEIETERPAGTGYEYCLRTGPHDIFTTKFRVPRGYKKPDVLIDPTYDDFVKVVRGEYKPQ